MSLLPDPITDAIGLFFTHAAESKLIKYLVLAFEMMIAAAVSFLFFCGSGLASKQPTPESIGIGMVMAAVAIVATFKSSPNSKGLVFSIPKQISDKEANQSENTEKK